MKKILLILILFPIIGISQKKNNGKVFDKHPAIDIAEKFNKAYEQGDIAILKSLVSKDFKMWNSMSNNPNNKACDINNLVGQSTYINNNFVDISLKNRGASYPDAIEYKKDGLHVVTYQVLTAWDKNNGFKLKTPRNSTFIFDKSGEKIRLLLWSDNQAAWNKWSLSRETIKNGTIYKDHPNIGTVRQIYYNLEHGDMEATFKDFSKKARIYDSNLIDKNFKTLDEHIENVKNIFSQFDIVSLDEVGYPDYLDYEGNGGVTLTWMKFTLKDKKSGEIKVMPVHSQMSFNQEGNIVREDVYYNASLLE